MCICDKSVCVCVSMCVYVCEWGGCELTRVCVLKSAVHVDNLRGRKQTGGVKRIWGSRLKSAPQKEGCGSSDSEDQSIS